ncbi:aspartate 1-decarboxylase [Roseimaritima ulvae]|uniref:Aspartate 1-decarboxylase n=1 Tax=Roseimaritima ulvae TaxID=980254 RepID=A0A5B9QKW6_9BACT|nr:aspartate 1-decarboxylase [Roseimaritima ulvae]QEG38402.1 Aspartate 1-decarboxylase precursor [Roseimaritima ulvae]
MLTKKLLSAKIHRLTVTGADVAYEGSFTLPPELMEAANIVSYESLHVWNVTRGTRLETYAIRGQTGSSDVCANGAAAHLIFPGDQVIVATYAFVADADVPEHQPRLIFVDQQNRITHTGPELPGPQRRPQSPVEHAPSAGQTSPAEQPSA